MVMAKVVGTVWVMELLEVDVLGLVVGTAGMLQLIFEQMGVLVFLDILKVVVVGVMIQLCIYVPSKLPIKRPL